MKFSEYINQYLGRWLTQDPKIQIHKISDIDRIKFELKEGDVLLVDGRSKIARIVKLITQSSWSHAALYIGKLNDIEDKKTQAKVKKHYRGSANSHLIIESELGEGTTVKDLSIYEHSHLRICRPIGLSHRDGQQVIKYAASQLGHEYDIRQIFDLLRFFLPYRLMPKRWGSSLFNFHPGQATKNVCSSMIAEAFSFIHFPILPLVKVTKDNETKLYQRNPKLCTPKDFDHSPYFNIIKYPFLDVSQFADHRLLPWQHSQSTLNKEEAEIYMTNAQLRNYKKIKTNTKQLKDTTKKN